MMDYIEKIFKRAKLCNIVDNILYGPEPEKECLDYEERMNEAYKKYSGTVAKYDPKCNSELYDAANALTEVISEVYMEIGFQAGLLFMQEIYYNSEKHRKATGDDQIK